MAGKAATAVKKVRELTEEDVLKAPDKDYMNEAQLAFFRRKLIELRDQLLQNADDAGARRFRLDALLGWPAATNPLLRGPGLLVANDGVFRKEDQRGIKAAGG